MAGPPVVVVPTNGRPVVNVASNAPPYTVVLSNGEPVTVVDTLGEPMVLLNYGLAEVLSLGATDAWDFVNDQYVRNGFSAASGLTVTRASSGYAETSDGRLVEFASGVLRRTDKGLLVEGARTNLLLRSQEFDTTWTASNVTVTANTTIAPDGTTTADLVYPATTGASRSIYQAVSGSNATYTESFFLKAAGKTWVAMIGITGSSLTATYFDLDAGVVGNVGSGQTAAIRALNNGWYLCSLTSTAVPAFVELRIVDANGSLNVTANGTDGIYIWGAQLEAASFPSSYIKTEGSTVTRAADQVTASLSGVAYPASLFAEIERVVDTGTEEHLFQTDTGSNNDRALLYVRSVDLAAAFAISNNVSQMDVSISGALATDAIYKLAGRFAANDGNAARDGNLGTADTSVTVPATPNTVRFGERIGGTNQPFGYIRKCAIFNTALSDADLQAVTT